MKILKSWKKKAISLMLVLVMTIGSFYIGGTEAKAAETTVGFAYRSQAFTSETGGDYWQNNLRSGVSDYSNFYGDHFITQEFSDSYMVYSEELSYEKLKDGMILSRMISNTFIRFKWADGTESFPDGSYFTIKKGAKIPYTSTGGGVSYAVLDSDYRFTFGADATVMNSLTVVPTVTSGLEYRSQAFTQDGTNYYWQDNLKTSLTDYSAYSGASFVTQEFSDTYMTYAGGLTYETLTQGMNWAGMVAAGFLRFRWANTTASFPDGASFTIKKGALIPYKSTTGLTAYMELDSDYQFTFGASSTNMNTLEVVPVTNYDIPMTFYGVNTDGTLLMMPHNNPDLQNTTVIQGMNFTGTIKLAGVDTAVVLQKSGNNMITENGKIDIYNNAGEFEISEGTVFTNRTNNAITTLTVTNALHYVRNAAGTWEEYQEPTNEIAGFTYRNQEFTSETGGFFWQDNLNKTISDYSSFYGDHFITQEFSDSYMVYSGGLTYEKLKNGMILSRMITSTFIRFKWAEGTESFPTGSAFVIKKGALIPYTNTSGTVSYVELDKDYRFEFGASASNMNSLEATPNTNYDIPMTFYGPNGDGTVLMMPHNNPDLQNTTVIQDMNFTGTIQLAGVDTSVVLQKSGNNIITENGKIDIYNNAGEFKITAGTVFVNKTNNVSTTLTVTNELHYERNAAGTWEKYVEKTYKNYDIPITFYGWDGSKTMLMMPHNNSTFQAEVAANTAFTGTIKIDKVATEVTLLINGVNIITPSDKAEMYLAAGELEIPEGTVFTNVTGSVTTTLTVTNAIHKVQNSSGQWSEYVEPTFVNYDVPMTWYGWNGNKDMLMFPHNSSEFQSAVADNMIFTGTIKIDEADTPVEFIKSGVNIVTRNTQADIYNNALTFRIPAGTVFTNVTGSATTTFTVTEEIHYMQKNGNWVPYVETVSYSTDITWYGFTSDGRIIFPYEEGCGLENVSDNVVFRGNIQLNNGETIVVNWIKSGKNLLTSKMSEISSVGSVEALNHVKVTVETLLTSTDGTAEIIITNGLDKVKWNEYWLEDKDAPTMYFNGEMLADGDKLSIYGEKNKDNLKDLFTAYDSISGTATVVVTGLDTDLTYGAEKTLTVTATDAFGNAATITVGLTAWNLQKADYATDGDSSDGVINSADLVNLVKKLSDGPDSSYDLNDDGAYDAQDKQLMRLIILGEYEVVAGCVVRPSYSDSDSAMILASRPPKQNDSSATKTYFDAGFTHIQMTEDHSMTIGSNAYNSAISTLGEDKVIVRNVTGTANYLTSFAKDYYLNGVDVFYYADEPTYSQVSDTSATGLFKQLLSSHNAMNDESGKENAAFLVNLFPSYATTAQIGNSFSSYVDAYVNNVLSQAEGKKILMIDHYPLVAGSSRNNNYIRENYLSDLYTIAAKAKTWNATHADDLMEVGQFIHIASNDSDLRNIESKADVTYQMNVALAMGVTNIGYFMYDEKNATEGFGGVYNSTTGAITNQTVYDAVKETNASLKKWDKLLQAYQWQGVATYEGSDNDSGFMGIFGGDSKVIKSSKDAMNALSTKLSSLQKISSISATRDVICSEFKDSKSGDYGYMLVNFTDPSASLNTNVTVTFNSNVSRLLIYKNGVPRVETITGNTYTNSYAPGEAEFIIPL